MSAHEELLGADLVEHRIRHTQVLIERLIYYDFNVSTITLPIEYQGFLMFFQP